MSNATVYRIRWDPDRFQFLLYDLADPSLALWTFNGTSKLSTWVRQPVYVGEPRLERPDIWHLVGAGVLVMNDAVIAGLEPFVSIAGELLPLQLTDTEEIMFALNILRDVNALDTTRLSIDRFEAPPDFIGHRLPETGLFKVPQFDTTDIFYVERETDEDSLISRIEERELRGISFEPVWTSASGPAPINLLRSSEEKQVGNPRLRAFTPASARPHQRAAPAN